MSLRTAAVEWIKAVGCHKRSAEDDRHRLRVLGPSLDGLTIRTVTADDLRRIRAKVLERDIAPSTANRYMAVLSTILRYAHKQGWCESVPAIPKTPEPRGRIRWITRHEAARLLDELPIHLHGRLYARHRTS